MSQTLADLILHPVRLRIVRTLAGGRELTVLQIGEQLPDVPPATLYRHINKLRGAKVIRAVSQRRIRGAVERVYALTEPFISLPVEGATREDHLRYFTAFVGGLLDDYDRYLGGTDADLETDGAGYRQVVVYLSDEELRELAARLHNAVEEFLGNGPGPGRRARALTTILIPVFGHGTNAPESD